MQNGQIELAYLDEAGFAQVLINRNAWKPHSEQHSINTPRGQRLNAMAALLNSGMVVHALYRGISTAKLFLSFVADLTQKVSKPLDMISIHDAAAIWPALARFEKQGITFKFLPPHSPEINRIETMWQLMKHRWLKGEHQTKEELKRAIQHVLEHLSS